LLQLNIIYGYYYIIVLLGATITIYCNTTCYYTINYYIYYTILYVIT